MFIKPELILVVFFGLVILIAIFWLFRIEKRLKRFFRGKKAQDLEDVIVFLEGRVKELEKARDDTEHSLSNAHQKLQKSIRGLHTVRFNPFADQGSNQSFAIGMLDENDNGVVISSLYARDRMSVFAKPIKKGQSKYDLSNEEKEALSGAKVDK